MDQENAPVHRLVHRFWNVAEKLRVPDALARSGRAASAFCCSQIDVARLTGFLIEGIFFYLGIIKKKIAHSTDPQLAL
jgi:hypothetical protein